MTSQRPVNGGRRSVAVSQRLGATTDGGQPDRARERQKPLHLLTLFLGATPLLHCDTHTRGELDGSPAVGEIVALCVVTACG